METGTRFKDSSEKTENRGIDLAISGLVVKRVIHYTTATPSPRCNQPDCDAFHPNCAMFIFCML